VPTPLPAHLLPRLLPPIVAFAVIGASGLARAEGPQIELGMTPDGSGAWMRACSVHHGACVYAAPRTSTRQVLAALDAIDRAWDVQTEAIELPAPDGGADGTWAVYLVDGVAEGGRAQLASRDPRGIIDRGVSFALIDRALPAGCPLDTAAARAVAWGSLLHAVPATDPGTARAQTRMLARLAAPCAGADEDERAFQAEPESTLVDPSSEPRSSGASLFFDWLDATFAGEPGALVAGTWALAPTNTPAGAARWSSKRTGFDVLAASLAGTLGTDSNLDDVFLRFGIDRALAPPPARVVWHVPWPSRPRRLASPVATPVAPTGASYVMIDHDGAPPGASLVVSAAWEDYGRMKWAVIKLDAAGRPLAVLPMTSQRLATSAALTVELVDAVDRFLVVGVNVGSTEHPFDPAQGWWEPHGWLLTLSPG
jgi:hypothetical protein